MNDRRKKRRTAGSVIASVFLSILLLVPMFLCIVLWEVRGIVSEEGMRYFLDEIKPEKIELSDLDPGESGTLLEAITDSVNESLKEQAVTPDEVGELLKNPSLKEFLSRELGDIAEDFKTGRSNAAVTKEELIRLAEKNWSLIEPLFISQMMDQITGAVDAAAAGYMEAELREALLDYRKTHPEASKYTGMLETLDKTGGIKPADRDLFEEYITKEYLSGYFKESLPETIPDDATERLNTVYLRSEIPQEASRIMNTAFSMVPVYLLLGICAIFCLLYFIADRHIPGDAFIGIGALLVTLIGPLAIAGLFYTGHMNAWVSLNGGSYATAFFSGFFPGFQLKTNLIGAGAGLGMIVLGIVINLLTRRKQA